MEHDQDDARTIEELERDNERLRAENVRLYTDIVSLEHQRDGAEEYASEMTWARERVEREYKAMERTASAIADERMGLANELLELQLAAQAVIDSAARELNYSPDVLLVSAAALRTLDHYVSSDGVNPVPASIEETRVVSSVAAARVGDAEGPTP